MVDILTPEEVEAPVGVACHKGEMDEKTATDYGGRIVRVW